MKRWGNLTKRVATAFGTLRRGSAPGTQVLGLPHGLSFETVATVCQDYFGAALNGVSYVGLSYWNNNVFRLYLDMGAAGRRTLIYKDAVRPTDRASRLVETLYAGQDTPFASEFQIYREADDALRAYLPRSYLVREVSRGRHYQFLLEDLSEYRDATKAEDTLRAVSAFSAIHDAMDRWAAAVGPARLLRYHVDLPLAFRDCVTETLSEYARTIEHHTVAEISRLVPRMYDAHDGVMLQSPPTVGLVHGDYHPWNVFQGQDSTAVFKIIDWADAGLGIRHVDLASLLSFAPPELEHEALEVFTRGNRDRPADEHDRLYLRCKLRRALIDAAFFAGRVLEGRAADSNADAVEAQLRRAIEAYEGLLDGPGHGRRGRSPISVVITCYNQARFLGEAIESVLGQTRPPAEVIVVDDGSADDPRTVVARYPSVRYIGQTNAGVAEARNMGLRACRGKYVVFLDGDDRLLSNALEVGADGLDARRECAFVFGRCRRIGPDGSPRPTPPWTSVDDNHYRALLADNYIWMPATVMYRRASLVGAGGFNAKADHSCDYDLYLRLARTCPIFCHGEAVAEWRQHDANVSDNSLVMLRSTLRTYRRQRRHVAKDPALRAAYDAGTRFWENRYATQVAEAVGAHVRGGRVGQAVVATLALLRYSPRVLAKRALGKLARAVGAG